MFISPIHVKRFIRRISRDNRKGRSYRVIAREDFPMKRDDGTAIVKPGTLNRIVKERGQWIPKDKEILIALGLKKPCKPRELKPPLTEHEKQIRKKIASMRAQTKNSMFIFDHKEKRNHK